MHSFQIQIILIPRKPVWINVMSKILAFFLSFLIMCTPANPIFEKYQQSDRKDHHSFSNPDKAITTHLELNLEADFNERILKGYAEFDFVANNASEIILDVRNLNISNVSTSSENNVAFSLGESVPFLGQALHIPISSTDNKIRIDYSTTNESSAVQWLNPEQTTDKKSPFLFTQGQAILSRTWIPCQDSPGIRITYNARIKTPKGMMAVMSASNPISLVESGEYAFEMKQAIPPYLIALAIGDIQFEAIGERTGVYAEQGMLEKAAFEFSEMERMLELAEGLYGPYLWERYDVIVLPSSFPFGGMENPRLTFATPTIIAGDRSLTSLIAHELAHSWSGNLVTNATWDDFWLNEGFTVYFERRIMEALYGSDYASMLAVLGYQDLEADVDDIGHDHKDTHLKLDLLGHDPDDGMTDIAYEKGAYFLGMLESKVGKEKFDSFLTQYFKEHEFQTITTSEFLVYLNENLLSDIDEEVNIEEWVFGPGIPENVVRFSSDKFKIVESEIDLFISESELKDHNNWTTHEWLHFIRRLPTDLSLQLMSQLDMAYKFSNSGNSEIAAAWYELSIKSGYFSENITQITQFLNTVGRRKFLTPLYKAMKDNNHLELARKIYSQSRNNYHAVSVQTMDDLLDYEKTK